MFRNSINPTDAKLWAPNFRVTGSLFKVQILDFPGGPVVKNSPSSAGDLSSFPGQGTKILHLHVC